MWNWSMLTMQLIEGSPWKPYGCTRISCPSKIRNVRTQSFLIVCSWKTCKLKRRDCPCTTCRQTQRLPLDQFDVSFKWDNNTSKNSSLRHALSIDSFGLLRYRLPAFQPALHHELCSLEEISGTKKTKRKYLEKRSAKSRKVWPTCNQ